MSSLDQFRAAGLAPLLVDAQTRLWTVPDRLDVLTDYTGWKNGDIVNQTGSALPRVATITFPDDLADTWVPRTWRLTFADIPAGNKRIGTLTVDQAIAASADTGFVFVDEYGNEVSIDLSGAGLSAIDAATEIASQINTNGYGTSAVADDEVVTLASAGAEALTSAWSLISGNFADPVPTDMTLVVTQAEDERIVTFVDENNTYYTENFGSKVLTKEAAATAFHIQLDGASNFVASATDHYVDIVSTVRDGLGSWQYLEPASVVGVTTEETQAHVDSTSYYYQIYDENYYGSYISAAASLAYGGVTKEDAAYALYNAINSVGLNVTATVDQNVVTITSNTVGLITAANGYFYSGEWVFFTSASGLTMVVTQADQDGVPPGTFIIVDDNQLGSADGYAGIGNTGAFTSGYGEPSNAAGELGDGYVDLYTNYFYKRDAAGWNLSLTLQGLPGDGGTNGTNGTNGTPGAAGAPAAGALTTLDKTRAVTTWTARTLTGSTNRTSICWSPELGLFCAVAYGSQPCTSPDGINWTARSSPLAQSYSVCWSPELGLFCSVGYNLAAAATSPDGITWTSRTLPSSDTWVCVCWAPELGLFCAVSASSTAAATSPDGINWTARTLPNNFLRYTMCWSPALGLFCIVPYNNSTALTSPDGINWTARTLPSASTWIAICWSPALGLFCAVANASTAVTTSPDGINWTARTTWAGFGWRSICWSPELGLFCTVASGSNSATTSPDGITWTGRALPSSTSWHSVCWSPELRVFCAVVYGNNTGATSRFPQKWDASGRYTPALTHTANISSSTSALCQWSRRGRVVTVSGRITIDPSAAGVPDLGVSLPVPSDFLNINDCGGTFYATGVKEWGGIVADVTNNRAQFLWAPNNRSSQPYVFQFSYYVY